MLSLGMSSHLHTLCHCSHYLPSGGAEQFIAGSGSFNGTDFYKAFQDQGYNVVYNKTDLESVGNDQKTLGIFSSASSLS
jgi:alkaline phosphatase